MKTGVRLGGGSTREYEYERVCGVSVDNFTYPEVFEIEDHVTVKDQGDKSACAAFAYATVLEHIFGKRMSEGFIYGMLRADSDKFPGMYVTRLLELAVKIGAVPLSAFGMLLEMPDIRDMVKKFPELLDVALKHRIEGFASLNYANAEKKHKAIQHALTFNLTADGKHIPLLAASNDYFHEPHAIVLRGWNDKDKTYKIQNSWGEEWGDGGYKFVPRDAIDGAYAIYPNKIALPFSDVTEKDWFFKDVKNMYLAGITNGTSETTFEPNRPITRAEHSATMNRHSKRDDEEHERIWRAINAMNDRLEGMI